MIFFYFFFSEGGRLEVDNGIVFEYLDTKIIISKRTPQHFFFWQGLGCRDKLQQEKTAGW